ncbi:Transcriptional regulatory protein WalR [Anaerolineae bacterium]|nr:Transcriptional regulatory protein WalR [Anaerolineae bacterium]
MNEKINRILVVDDEAIYIRGIRAILEAKGYDVLTAQDGQSGIDLAARENPDLILLDVKMPGLDGYTTCQRIREFSTAPVIMLTALAETKDKVKGLEQGADDYVTKPFSTQELLARVNAALRRTTTFGKPESKPALQVNDLQVNFAQQRVFVGEREVELTSTEYRLLCELVRNAGQVLSSEHLLEQVWGVGYEGETRLVWRVIHALRQKIDRDPQKPHIETRAGSGYVFLDS